MFSQECVLARTGLANDVLPSGESLARINVSALRL